MREIKFKAWNPRLKQMSEPFTIEKLLTAEVSLLHKTSHDEPIEWLQYTGLKDKNGKEIYDGDIVRVSKDVLGGTKDEVCQIEWDGGCGYQIESDESGCFSLTDFGESDLKVLGNIYENLELLEAGGK